MLDGSGGRTRDDQEIEARTAVDRADRQPEGLAKTPANTISGDRASQRSGRRDRDTDLEEPIRSRAECEEAMLQLCSIAPHERDLRAPPQTRGVHEGRRARRR